MKRIALLLILCLFSTGCSVEKPLEITIPQLSGNLRQSIPGKTDSCNLLKTVWSSYTPEEQFSIFGGIPEQPVMDAPGDLDLAQFSQWQHRYRFPAFYLDRLEEGASFSHLMNETIFTAVSFRIRTPEKISELANQWRHTLQNSPWSPNQPAQLLIAQANTYLLMAYGSSQHVLTFENKLCLVFPDTDILYREPITL